MGHQVTGVGVKATAEKAREEPPRRVIPIVFVPGIAGSNLRVRGGKEIRDLVRKRMNEPDIYTKPGEKFLADDESLPAPWHPPDGKLDLDALPCVNRWDNYGPVQRQALLNAQTTCVDDDGFLELGTRGLSLSPSTKAGREFRGWKSLHLGSYLGILKFLEMECNESKSSKIPTLKDRTEDHLSADLRILVDGPYSRKQQKTLEKFGLADCRMPLDKVKKIFECQMPVYAFGYNWLESNNLSAQILLERTQQIINLYNEARGNSGQQLFLCEKVILVTHSMGGLVARAATHLDKKKIFLGVVHGVMPAVGTPSAYQRMATGTEGGVEHDALLAVYRNPVEVIMGLSPDRTTPALANNAGPLQLLPSKEHPPNWLECSFHRNHGPAEPIFKLPETDPYTEIYEKRDAWYRLVNPDLIDPCKAHRNAGVEPWEHYLKMLEHAKRFHASLKKNQAKHPITFAFYGADPFFSTWGTARWHLKEVSKRIHVTKSLLLAAKPCTETYNEKNGRVSRIIHIFISLDRFKYDHTFLTLEIQGRDAPGDGTVSWQSGSAPNNTWLPGKIRPLKGLDHQHAFDCDQARWFTLWSICQILEFNNEK